MSTPTSEEVDNYLNNLDNLDDLDALLRDAQSVVDACMQEHSSYMSQLGGTSTTSPKQEQDRNSPPAQETNAVISESDQLAENTVVSIPSYRYIDLTNASSAIVDPEDSVSVIALPDVTDPVASNSTNFAYGSSSSSGTATTSTATINSGRNELTTDNVPSSSLSSNDLAAETLSVCAEVIDLCARVVSRPSEPILIDLCSQPSTPTSTPNAQISPSTNMQFSSNDDDVVLVGEIGPIRNNRLNHNRQVEARSNFAYPINPPVVLVPPKYSASDSLPVGSSLVETGADANINSKMQCSVCLDDSTKNEPTSTKCGHVFCGPCIRKALMIRKKCPLCNKICGPRQLLRLFV